MRRHLAIVATGALMLSVGVAASIDTVGNAIAAMRPGSTARPATGPRPNATRSHFTTHRKVTSSRKLTTTKRLTSRKLTSKRLTTRTRLTGKPLPRRALPLHRPPVALSKGPNLLRRPPTHSVVVAKPLVVTLINKRNFTIFRGPRGIWWNGRVQNLVALTALGSLTIGTTYYLADGYVPIALPLCRGITQEGCALVWRDVPTDDGDMIAQCVQFCPRSPSGSVAVVPKPTTTTPAPGPTSTPDSKTSPPTADTPAAPAPSATPSAPGSPPAATPANDDTRTAAAPITPTSMAQGCDMSIHAEPNFTGNNSEVTSDYPLLSSYGWDKAISSVKVKTGIWDFYTEENYGGIMIRLAPGQYPTLAQGWDKAINSLMCSQP